MAVIDRSVLVSAPAPAPGSAPGSSPGAGRVVQVSPSVTTQRYKLTVAYDGWGFHGWQKQIDVRNGGEPLRTVAGVLEATLARVLRQPIDVVGASRTDAGVHARGQVAHFDAVPRIPLARMAEAVNSRLPDDVEVVAVEPVPDGFDAIRDAQRKRYRYRVFNSPRRPLTERHTVWHDWRRLDDGLMSQAADRLVGTHDFAGFAAAGHGRITTVRTVSRCEVIREHPQLWFVIEGGGFLYNMVRIIAGTLIEVGRGRFDPGVIDRVLASGNRRLAGPTLPGRGLCLEQVWYA